MGSDCRYYHLSRNLEAPKVSGPDFGSSGGTTQGPPRAPRPRDLDCTYPQPFGVKTTVPESIISFDLRNQVRSCRENQFRVENALLNCNMRRALSGSAFVGLRLFTAAVLTVKLEGS